MDYLKRFFPKDENGFYMYERGIRNLFSQGVRIRQRLIHGDLIDPQAPKIIGLSIPKSGTNLLRQALAGFCKIGPFVDIGAMVILTFEPGTGRQRAVDEILQDIQRLKPGDIATAHLHADEQIIREVDAADHILYFMYRDPRDLAISHMHYVTYMRTSHIHHEYYLKQLSSDEERIKTSIAGYRSSDRELLDINSRYQPYIDWLKQDRVLAVPYEGLILQREKAIGKIVQHFEESGFPLPVPSQEAVRKIADNIRPERSRTFRKGKVGAWREIFSEDLKNQFKESAGDLLIELGYEKDLNW